MKKVLLIFFSLVFTLSAFAQREIAGKVTDAVSGEPLPGVNVIIKGTTTGTITDLDGNYALAVTSEDEILVFSFVGYINAEVLVAQQTKIDIALDADILGFDEIVVIGYGTQKKSLVTGSIAKVESEDIMSTAPTRAEQSLQGKTAGVTVMQSSGAPGSALSVTIRGVGSNFNTEPLYVVDGMRVNTIDFLNPADIESMEVLKDAASAAIYGSQGANGVVIITTKTGTNKKTTQVNYDFYYGIQSVPNPLDMMDAKEFATYKYEAIESRTRFINRDNPPIFQDLAVAAALRSSKIPHPDSIQTTSNWVDEIFQQAPVVSHNLSFSGGNEDNSYAASLGYFSQDGVIGGPKSNYTRYSLRLNTNHTLKPWLDGGTKFMFSRDQRNQLPENNEYGGLVMNAILLDPVSPLYFENLEDMTYYTQALERFGGDSVALASSTAMQDGNGFYGQSEIVTNEIVNPIAQINNTHTKLNKDRVLAGLYFDLKPVKDLKIHSQLDFDYLVQKYHNWYPIVFYQPRAAGGTLNGVNERRDTRFTWQWENYATYTKAFGDHSITALIGTTIRKEQRDYIWGTGNGMQEETDEFAYLGAMTIDSLSRNGGITEPIRNLASFFGRLSYNYSEKYMLELVLRRDGSSMFAPNNQFASFPSASAGWVISREDFWTVNVINNLKVRASWGQNGSLSNLVPFRDVSSISTLSTPAPASGITNPIFNLDGTGSTMTAAQPTAVPNPDLVWETSEQTNIGVDFGFLSNRLTLSVDYFNKQTKDLLARGGVMAVVGNEAPWINAGEITNRGVEFEAGYKQAFGDLSINVNATAAYLKNEVTHILQDGYILPGSSVNGIPITQFEKGRPAWYFIGYETAGIFQNEEELNKYPHVSNHQVGDLRYVDQNKDGLIDDADRVYIGKPWADWTFGVNLGLNYKGIDFGAFVNGSIGNDILSGYHRTDLNGHNLQKRFLADRWTPGNQTNSMFKPSYNGANMHYSDFWVEDGSWVKIRTLTLGYTIPTFAEDVNPVKKFRIYLQAQNLYTFTRYTGMDPEIGNTAGSTTDLESSGSFSSYGVDRGFYPSPRTYIIGLNLTF